MRSLTPSRNSLAVFATAWILASAAASQLSADGPLGRYVPAGVHFYGCWTASEASDRIEKPYLDAIDKLVRSGIGDDIFQLATMGLDDEERAGVRAIVDKVLGLLGTPDWDHLAKTEVALAFRIAVPFPQYLVLFRVTEDTAEARRGELHKMLEGFASFAPGSLKVSEMDRNGAKVSRLSFEGFPAAISVASKGDVVTVCTAEDLLDGALGLMDSEDAGGSIVKTGRFVDAQRGAPEGAYGVAFFDLAGYLGVIRSMLGMASGFAQGDPAASGVLSIVGTVLDELSRFQTVSSVEQIQENRYTVDVRVAMAQQDGPGFFEKLIRDQKPIGEYARAVPKDASSFCMTSGVNPQTLYDAVLGLVRDRVPGGEDVLALWEHIQAQAGLNLKNDLLSWIDGGCGCLSLPARSGASGGCLVFLRVKDDEKARSFIERVLNKVRPYLESRGHSMDLVEIYPEGFRELRISALPWCRPVIGIPEGTLVIASSANVVQRVAETYEGSAPSILENPRLAMLDIPEDKPLSSIGYQDVENAMEPLANLLGTVGFVASLLPEERDTRPVIKLGSILTKLAAFVRDIDLVTDYGGYSYYDAEHHEIRSHQVRAFRSPKKSRDS